MSIINGMESRLKFAVLRGKAHRVVGSQLLKVKKFPLHCWQLLQVLEWHQLPIRLSTNRFSAVDGFGE